MTTWGYTLPRFTLGVGTGEWPNVGVPGQLTQDLPTWTQFEQAAKLVTADDLLEHVPCKLLPAL